MRVVTLLLALSAPFVAGAVDDVTAVVVYEPGQFASAGQPEPEQFDAIAKAGYGRVIYLAYSDHPGHDSPNDRLAHKAGLDYVHIPVRFDAPRYADFAVFRATLNAAPKPTFVHCQVNYRASAFSFLYRVIDKGIPVATAKADLDRVWRPNAVWQAFMRETLARHNKSLDCASCDWTLPDAD